MLRMEGRGKQGSLTVLTGQCDCDFIGKVFRLFLRYCYIRKIAEDYLFQKKNLGRAGEVCALKGDEGILCISMHLFA